MAVKAAYKHYNCTEGGVLHQVEHHLLPEYKACNFTVYQCLLVEYPDPDGQFQVPGKWFQYFFTYVRNPLKEYRRAMLLKPAAVLQSLIIQRENQRMNTKTSAAPATTLLNADDPLIDMHFITTYTNMTDKWFYKLIGANQFPKPIKLGRSSRWRKSEVEAWMQERVSESRPR